MKFGVNTLIWTSAFGREHLDLMPRVKEWGFDIIEIARFNWDGFPAAEIRRAAERNGLGVATCTALPGVSLIHDDAGERAKAVEFMRQAIDSTAEMGGRIVAGPIYSPVGFHTGAPRTGGEWQREVESLQTITAFLDEYEVELGVEPLNRFETHFLNTAADGARLCDEVGHRRVGLLYDTFHANIEEKSQAGAIAAAARHLKHVHSCENDRGVPGTGHIEWAAVFAALRKAGYDGCLTIESFGFAIPEIVAAACIWRDLAPTPDHIAFEGVQFLKQSLS